jgi:hypothetical protein
MPGGEFMEQPFFGDMDQQPPPKRRKTKVVANIGLAWYRGLISIYSYNRTSSVTGYHGEMTTSTGYHGEMTTSTGC